MAAVKTCGECTLCCKLLGVMELEKPIGVMCEHSSPDIGCTIYESRPQTCRLFNCLWLISDLPETLKPSICGIVFSFTRGNEHVIGIIDPIRPDDFNSPIIKEFGQRLDSRGIGLFGLMANSTDLGVDMCADIAGNKTAEKLLKKGVLIRGASTGRKNRVS